MNGQEPTTEEPTSSNVMLPPRYEFLGFLGRGAMGEVLEVFDHERGHSMALKRLPLISPMGLLSLKNEFRVMRDLHHPNLVELGELAEHSGEWFFTMEVVSGSSWLDWVWRRESRGGGDGGTLNTLATMHTLATEGIDPTAVGGTLVSGEALIAGEDPIEALQSQIHGPSASRGAVPQLDYARLRDSLVQLTGAVQALHAAGVVHRDLKPSNVLVTREGRVVLLDLGVAMAADGDHFSSDLLIGTPEFMAPEQLEGEASPASDWYALGTMIHRALTGRFPYRGLRGVTLLRAKHAQDPVTLVESHPDLPLHWARLCDGLLRRDPTQRAGADALLSTLGASPRRERGASSDAFRRTGSDANRRTGSDASKAHPESTSAPIDLDGLSLGHDAELGQLQAAYLDVVTGETRLLELTGPAGIGKSTLLDRFLASIDALPGAWLVLRGRCHEQESVPFRAFDEAIDSLGRTLSTMAEAELQAIAPDDVRALLRVFPSLATVSYFEEQARAARPLGTGQDLDAKVRHDAFEALRALIRGVARFRTVVFAIDDFHWADADSRALLRALTDTPKPRFMLVTTSRPSGGPGAPVGLKEFDPEAQSISVRSLEGREARAAVAHICAREGLDIETIDVRGIVEASGGHPLFLEELLRHSAQGVGGVVRSVEEAVERRFQGLEPASRRLIEVLACVGAPVAHRVCRTVAGLDASEYARIYASLRTARWVRIEGSRADDLLETYHDGIRRAVYGSLDDARRVSLHGGLAAALREADVAPDIVARQLELAGDLRAAAEHYERAARRAAEAVAFDQATEHFKRALALGDHFDAVERRDIHRRCAHAQWAAGELYAAAKTYGQAAELAEPDDPARAELETQASACYLQAGHVDEGLRSSRVVLRRVGLSYPRNRIQATLRIVWGLFCLVFTRFRWRSTPANEGDPALRARLEVVHHLGKGLGYVSPDVSAGFATLAPGMALRLGEDELVAEAMAVGCFSISTLSFHGLARRMCDAAHVAAERVGTSSARWYAHGSETALAYWERNDWEAALAGAEAMKRFWLAGGRGHVWEVGAMDQFAIWSLERLGRHREGQDMLHGLLNFAERTRNRYHFVSLRTYLARLELLDDQPEEVAAAVEAVIEGWSPESWVYTVQEYWMCVALMDLALYRGDPTSVLRRLQEEWSKLERAATGRVEIIRVERARRWGAFCVELARVARERGDMTAARDAIAEAKRQARILRRSSMPMARGGENYLVAAIAYFEGDVATARRRLRWARRHVRGGQIAWLEATLRLAQISDIGEEKRELSELIARWNREQRVANPESYWAMLAPGFGRFAPDKAALESNAAA